MQLIRFVGREELVALNEEGKILPKNIHNAFSDGAGKEVIYTFPLMEYTTPKNRLDYLTGIVTANSYNEDGGDYYICLFLDIPDTEIEEGYGTYADPYGSFFDTISEKECYIKQYTREQVFKVEIYYEAKSSFSFKKVYEGDLLGALSYNGEK